MSSSFQSETGIIIVRAESEGPNKSSVLQLVLNTGATRTVINSRILVVVGYDPAPSGDRLEMTTASGIDFAPVIVVSKIRALGRVCRELSVLSHTLPPSAGVDGLLGLDFFRGQVLTIDFREGVIRLS